MIDIEHRDSPGTVVPNRKTLAGAATRPQLSLGAKRARRREPLDAGHAMMLTPPST
jgi:hypothetical protein